MNYIMNDDVEEVEFTTVYYSVLSKLGEYKLLACCQVAMSNSGKFHKVF